MRQATVAPSILSSEDIKASKIERAIEIVEDLLAADEKVVIMSTFKEPVYLLQKALYDYNPLIGTGDIDDAQVFKNVELFQTDPKYKVFIGTASKCGTGLNLNAARYMICLDEH